MTDSDSIRAIPRPVTLDDVYRAVQLPDFDPISAMMRMTPRPRPFRREGQPGRPREASVLILLYEENGVLYFPLMRRPEYDGVHSGQISLPGGKRENGEGFDENAIRETREELGVVDHIEMIGPLGLLYVPPSDFEIHPYVGRVALHPTWQPDPEEVAEVIETPLSFLFDDKIKDSEVRTFPDGIERTLPFYRINGHKVWGATAAMLSEFEERIRTVLTK